MKTYDTVSNWFMWCLISYIICSKIKSFFKVSFSLKNEKDDHQGWNSEKTSFELLDQLKWKNCVGPL